VTTDLFAHFSGSKLVFSALKYGRILSGAALKSQLGPSQNHLAVAGGYVVDALEVNRLRTHPLPRGGSDPALRAAPGRILPNLASENPTFLPEKWAKRSVVTNLQ